MSKKLEVKANLVLNHPITDRKEVEPKKKDKDGRRIHSVIEPYIKECIFDIVEDVPSKKLPQILTPNIKLSGEFFQDFLDSGKIEQYEVEMTITARRTSYEHKGVPDVIETPAGETEEGEAA